METASAGALATLSERERAVATRYAEGLTYREIGRALSIAPATVCTHLAAVYEKLGVHNKTALIRLTAMPAVEPQPAGTPPVIAVLPFRVAADHPRWERLGDGLTHDVITDLGRHSGLWVIAAHTMLGYRSRDVAVGALRRELGARYVVSGSLQAGDGRVRVRADLSDAATGMQLWAERYDEPEGEVFAIQDEIARRIVNALAGWSGGVARAGLEVARRKVPSSLEAYDLYLLAAEQKHRFTKESVGEAIRLMSRAVAIDPGFAGAWTCLGLAPCLRHRLRLLRGPRGRQRAVARLHRAGAGARPRRRQGAGEHGRPARDRRRPRRCRRGISPSRRVCPARCRRAGVPRRQLGAGRRRSRRGRRARP